MDNSTIERINEICRSLGMLTIPPPDKLAQNQADAVNESLKEMLKNTGLDKYLRLI
jgi:hypothetical protein